MTDGRRGKPNRLVENLIAWAKQNLCNTFFCPFLDEKNSSRLHSTPYSLSVLSFFCSSLSGDENKIITTVYRSRLPGNFLRGYLGAFFPPPSSLLPSLPSSFPPPYSPLSPLPFPPRPSCPIFTPPPPPLLHPRFSHHL